MRMRKKKNIDLRIKNCSDVLALNPQEYKGKWKDFFENDNPIYIEIGCGKGTFIETHAKNNKNINYIAIEREENALIIATERALNQNIENLVFINVDALKLCDIFETGEIHRIYLNFSDPWPQRKHEKRRLTHGVFLDIYNQVLCTDGQIHFKTDNQNLFEFSIEQLTKNGFCLQNLSLDLHNTNRVNVMTEYEKRFSEMGFRIYRVEALRYSDFVEEKKRRLEFLEELKQEESDE